METLWRLMAVLSGVLFTAGTSVATPKDTPVRDARPVIWEAQEPSNSVSGPIPARYPTVPATAKCPMWWVVGLRAGWKWADMPKLDYLMWRESRCVPTAFNAKDPNGGSLGLAQINFYWCKSSRWYPAGYLQTQNVLARCEDLADPTVNLTAALAIQQESGWGPWGLDA